MMAGRDACDEFRRLRAVPQGAPPEDALSHLALDAAMAPAKLLGDGALFVFPHPEVRDVAIQHSHRRVLASLSLFLAGRISERFSEALHREKAVDEAPRSWDQIIEECLRRARERLPTDPALTWFALRGPLVSVTIDRGDVQLLPSSGSPEIIGTPVNVAARLLAIGDPGTVLITDEVYPWLSADDQQLFQQREEAIQGIPGGRIVYELRLPPPTTD